MFIILLLNKSDTMDKPLSRPIVTGLMTHALSAITKYGYDCTPAQLLTYISMQVNTARAAAAAADTKNKIVSGNLQALEEEILRVYIDEQYLGCVARSKTDATRTEGSNCGPSDTSSYFSSKVRVAEQKVTNATTDENMENAKHELHYAQVMYNTHYVRTIA
jgi:hypothetical protein